uniref:Uncharacterized protein n=1 Tax=Stegastes partitus TaxID=144197 RepID=A0A3B5BC96_9TELE
MLLFAWLESGLTLLCCAVSLSLGMAQKFVVPACDQNKFDSNVENLIFYFLFCLPLFLCSIYNELKWCVDRWANASWCKGQRFLVDEVFLEVHRTYFSLCGQVHDPSLSTLIMLIAPSIIATLLLPLLCVHLTTWNTERPGSLGL